jgi:hypothetical protein
MITKKNKQFTVLMTLFKRFAHQRKSKNNLVFFLFLCCRRHVFIVSTDFLQQQFT